MRNGSEASVFLNQHFGDFELPRLDYVDTVSGVTLSVNNLVFDSWHIPELIGQLANRGLCQLGKKWHATEELDLFVELLFLNLTKNQIVILLGEHSKVSVLEAPYRSHPWF